MRGEIYVLMFLLRFSNSVAYQLPVQNVFLCWSMFHMQQWVRNSLIKIKSEENDFWGVFIVFSEKLVKKLEIYRMCCGRTKINSSVIKSILLVLVMWLSSFSHLQLHLQCPPSLWRHQQNSRPLKEMLSPCPALSFPPAHQPVKCLLTGPTGLRLVGPRRLWVYHDFIFFTPRHRFHGLALILLECVPWEQGHTAFRF